MGEMYHALTREYAELAVAEFLHLYDSYESTQYSVNKDELVFVVADSAVFFIKFDVNCDFMEIEYNKRLYLEEGVCGVDIEELTPNTILPAYKHSPFMEQVQEKIGAYTTFIRYARFRGINQHYLANGVISKVNYVMEQYPQVCLQERYNAWTGIPYTVVIFEMFNIDGSIAYAADAIRGNVHSFVLKIANNLAKKNYDTLRLLGFGLSEFYKVVDDRFIDNMQSHKNKGRIARLQDNLRYFSLDPQYFKDEKEIILAVKKHVDNARHGRYDKVERIEYNKPEYRWKTEEYVYKIVKKYYKDYGVIYQHRPLFLHSSLGGQMSYDIYIARLKIAIEYQGKQHFEPIDYFGGEESFQKVLLRDKEKRELSQKNGVKLLYINYWEDVTPDLVRKLVDDAIDKTVNI